MRILFVSYFFPPNAYATGVKRTTRIIKRLREHGVEPLILTARDYTFIKRDESFLRELPEDLVIFRPKALEPSTFLKNAEFLEEKGKKPFRYFIWPDSRILWLINALPQISKIIKNFKPHGMVVQAPPFSSLVLGLLANKLHKLPYILDMWDPWSDDLYGMYPTFWQKNLTDKAEESLMKGARGIIVVTYPMKYRLLHRYPFLESHKIEVITFGYEEDEMKDIGEIDYNPPLKILYLGSLFGIHKDPRVFFEAFHEFIKKGNKNVKLILVGTKSSKILDLASSIPKENIELIPYIPHSEILKFIRSSHILWLLTTPGPGYDLIMPSKLFEYLGARRPILATVPPGWVQDFLKRINAFVCDPVNKSEILDTLYRIWSSFENKKLPLPPQEVRAFYSYENLSERYAVFLKERFS